MRALQHWEHYLIQKELILHSDYHTLKYMNSQKNISRMHARWILFLQKFTFHFKHRTGKLNKAIDALSRRATLLLTLQIEITGFESLKDQYADDEDFSHLWAQCLQLDNTGNFHIQQGFLFKENQLCIPKTSLREFIIRDLHSSGLAAHTGSDKTITSVEEHFY